MANTPKTYPPESDVAELITELVTSGKPLDVVVGEETYTLELASRTRKKPDPETVTRSMAAIRATAGGWKDFDAERFLEYIYARRGAISTRPSVKL